MSETSTMGTVSASAPDSGSVNQGDIVNDFNNTEFISQEIDHDPSDIPNEYKPQPIKGKTPEQAPATPAQPTPQGEKPRQAQPAPSSQTQISELDKPFYNEKGEFQADKWIEQFVNTKRPTIDPVTPSIDASMAQPAQNADGRPEWQRKLEERRTYETNLSNNLTSFKGLYIQARQAGLDEAQAIQRAEGQIREWLNKHLVERDYESQYKEREEAAKSQAEAVQTAQHKPLADANINLVASEFGGVDKLNKLLMTKELGGDMVLWLFDQANAGVKYPNKEAYGKAMESWWVKFAQNPHNIRRVATYGLMSYRDKYLPQVIKSSQAGQQRAGAASARAQTPAPRTVQEKRAPAARTGLEQFFGVEGGQLQSQEISI